MLYHGANSIQVARTTICVVYKNRNKRWMRGRERIRENDDGMETVRHGPDPYMQGQTRTERPSID